ncbi:hypothetical protein NPIL_650031 [Nephila pilipes]|uniref:Uncharacterized protein n=1 Tax=Nephila pilipes TaxID=299642 RepID=A0A8X6P2J8_NEPPI|nr:hypothetical protein NPIL_650031 [Nephila pilipes]
MVKKLLHNLEITSNVNSPVSEIFSIQSASPPTASKPSSRTCQDNSKEENFLIKVDILPPPSQNSLEDFQASKKVSFLLQEKIIIRPPLAFQNSEKMDVSPSRKYPSCSFVAKKREKDLCPT